MSSSSSTPVTRHTSDAAPTTFLDQVAVEEPLEIRVEGRSIAQPPTSSIWIHAPLPMVAPAT
jgi:formate dehydrogenase assembly factor FdhD